jgi:hypothetical protein
MIRLQARNLAAATARPAARRDAAAPRIHAGALSSHRAATVREALAQASQLGTYPAAKWFVLSGGLPKVCTTF